MLQNILNSWLLIIPAIVIIALITIGLIFAKLYRRSTKEVSFVRTGLGGQKVIMNGGALVLPIVHETIPVNMNTNRLQVARAKEQALITKDRMRVDVAAEFYVRVSPNEEAIATAAQTLGKRTMHIEKILELIEGKFVDALRSVAAKMAMEELHEQRVNFVQEVQVAVSEDLQQNGLELETVSLTGLDQTDKEYFNPQNAFDAEGLTKLTQSIEERRKRRNDIEQDTQVAMQTKDLEAERHKLELRRDTEYANLNQQREVENYRAEQAAEIAKQKANQERAAQEAKIIAEQQVEHAMIEKKQAIAEKEIAQRKAVESTEIERKKAIELAEQERAIAIANKSKEESEAKAEADLARAEAVKAEETVNTYREVAQADRQKQIELIEAHKQAEREAIGITTAADANKRASEDEAEANRLRAQGQADAIKIAAQSDAEATKIRAEANEVRYKVEAEGKRQINEAANTLSETQIEMQLKLKALEQLPAIIEQSVKPMERIEGIKIYQIEGLNTVASSGEADNNNANLAEQVTNAALRYRMHAPLLDNIMKEIGLNLDSGINGMTAGMNTTPPNA
ncbi:membrane protein [Candidatus Thiomargarita nelsonii]|uniref:Membrane protein n=1 Tax=Candidatus Thiomargarita nelsonii TaxID=1003181 RepID=A0A0A6PH14_9GAMM|nr:membrane protein [Candidatus Thiomargarita nelsonii]